MQKEGTAHPSMVSRYLEENENGGDIPEVAIMDMASDAYGGEYLEKVDVYETEADHRWC